MQGGGIPPFPPAQLGAAKFYYSETLARDCFCRGTVFIHASLQIASAGAGVFSGGNIFKLKRSKFGIFG
ncbi:hypothetical protein TMES_04995 [Thalassospira mesophila]|uniref:Uncharacterized protein n=1 Tax=Thalassospira mesophila TaxID=1293891 RepID=A0A1Y2L245_9PROT|nr:hypothetical protein TMES_04995 [Thalassospira mesophila]